MATLGRATIKHNGKKLKTKRGATLLRGGTKRDPVVGSTEVHGFSAQTVAPQLRCRITQTSDVDLKYISDIENATIVWAGDDGKNYILTGACSTDSPTLSEVEGEMDCTFGALTCEPL